MKWSRKAPLILFFIEVFKIDRILIVGAHSFASGKTRLAVGLGKSLKDSGQSVEYFKPASKQAFGLSSGQPMERLLHSYSVDTKDFNYPCAIIFPHNPDSHSRAC